MGFVGSKQRFVILNWLSSWWFLLKNQLYIANRKGKFLPVANRQQWSILSITSQSFFSSLSFPTLPTGLKTLICSMSKVEQAIAEMLRDLKAQQKELLRSKKKPNALLWTDSLLVLSCQILSPIRSDSWYRVIIHSHNKHTYTNKYNS